MTLEELLRQGKSFGQGASNAAASTVTGPVDMLAWLLRKGGVNVGDAPMGGEAWMRQKGLMATPENRLAGLLGEGAGLAAPIVAAAKAPEIAGGLLQMGRNLATPQTLNKQTGAIVWHGSPHKFVKFDSSKIGTGEGKQQQGIGAYLAESKQVGQKYADKEAWKRGMDDGYLYKIDIPDEAIAKMANYDAPFSQQPESVRNAVLPMLGEQEIHALKGYHGWENLDDAPFAAVMNSMEIAKGNNRAATSEALRKAGIPGIRYLDGGSRSAGAGSSNFVVFPGNEGLLKILERNGGKP